MSGIKKILTISAFILLIMAVLLGCPMLLKDSTVESGQYIELNIGSEAVAKAITVTEYDVTKLEVEIYDPQGALIDDFSWYPDEGQQSYLIPVAEEGKHEIVVTHISDDNGTVIEAEESAFFNIEAMVITAINIVPGLIGYIDISPGNDDPLEPIDLTGYWDLFMALGGEPEMEPMKFYIHQTGSTLEGIYGFSGSISGSTITMEALVDMGPVPEYVFFTGTLSEGVIFGTISGVLGNGTLRFVSPSTMPFGRFDLEAMVEGSPISLHTDYALGEDGGTETMSSFSFDLMMGPMWGSLLMHTEELSVGHYTTEDMEFNLWDGMNNYTAWGGYMDIIEFTETRAIGNFYLNFDEGDLHGSFDLIFDEGIGHTTVDGMWQGIPVSGVMPNAYSNLDVQMSHSMTINYGTHEQQVDLWFTIPSDMVLHVPFEEWVDLRWNSETGPSYDDYISIESVMFTITYYDGISIAGSFESGSPFNLTGSFDVGIIEAPF